MLDLILTGICASSASHDIALTSSSLNLPHEVLRYLIRTMKQVYAAHTRKVCLMCLWGIPVMCAQFLLGTIANLSLREYCVAICTAADSLHHLCVRNLYPILDRASSKCPPFLPLLRILLASCSWELTRATDADYRLPVLRKNCSSG